MTSPDQGVDNNQSTIRGASVAEANAQSNSASASVARQHSTRKLSRSGESLYVLLGLQKGADDEQIKRAYRKAALKHHPDKTGNDPELAEKFKEINYANVVLTDPTKKRIYDQYGSFGLRAASTLGEENFAAFALMQNPWFKGLLVCCGIITGCYCCCCCCCCCFCCGKMKPPPQEDADAFYYEFTEEEDAGVVTSQPKLTKEDNIAFGSIPASSNGTANVVAECVVTSDLVDCSIPEELSSKHSSERSPLKESAKVEPKIYGTSDQAS